MSLIKESKTNIGVDNSLSPGVTLLRSSDFVVSAGGIGPPGSAKLPCGIFMSNPAAGHASLLPFGGGMRRNIFHK